MRYSLIDMMNLARTRIILGSGYSSYSEVAAQMGGKVGRSLPILMAGRDFGKIVERKEKRSSLKNGPEFNSLEMVDLAGFGFDGRTDGRSDLYVQRYWPRPF